LSRRSVCGEVNGESVKQERQQLGARRFIWQPFASRELWIDAASGVASPAHYGWREAKREGEGTRGVASRVRVIVPRRMPASIQSSLEATAAR